MQASHAESSKTAQELQAELQKTQQRGLQQDADSRRSDEEKLHTIEDLNKLTAELVSHPRRPELDASRMFLVDWVQESGKQHLTALNKCRYGNLISVFASRRVPWEKVPE